MKTAFPLVGGRNNTGPRSKPFGESACPPGGRHGGLPARLLAPQPGQPAAAPRLSPPRKGSLASSGFLKLLSLRWREGGARL